LDLRLFEKAGDLRMVHDLNHFAQREQGKSAKVLKGKEELSPRGENTPLETQLVAMKLS
jgi:hypothetical protein